MPDDTLVDAMAGILNSARLDKLMSASSAWFAEDSLRGGGRARLAGAVFLVVALFHLLGTWSLPLIDRDEPRFAEAAREMIERDDYIVPYFNDDYRFDKPPLIYWLMCASYGLFGETDFAARLPSVLAAAAICALLFLWGVDAFGSYQRALLAAALFGTCLQTFMHARAAVADMVMILFMSGAYWVGWRLLEARSAPAARQLAMWAVFAVCLGLGFLTKGPVAWLPLLPLLAMGAVMKRGWAFQLAGVASLLAAAGLVLVWAVPALRMTDGEYFDVGIGKHVVQRSLDVMEGHGAGDALGYIALLPLYFVTVFISFFPGSLLLPAHVRSLWRRRPGRFSLYLGLQVLLVFVVFSLLKTKLPHYTLPAFPALAMWLALQLGDNPRLIRRFSKTAIWSSGVLAALALALFPLLARLTPSHQLAAMAADSFTPDMRFASVEYVEPSLVWYLRAHTDGFHKKRKPAEAAEYLERDGARALVTPSALVDQLGDLSGYRIIQAEGLNIAKGDWLDLTMVVKREARQPPADHSP